MDSNCTSSGRRISTLGQMEREKNFQADYKRSIWPIAGEDDKRNQINADTIYPSMEVLNSREQSPFKLEKPKKVYSRNSPETRVIVERGHSRTHWLFSPGTQNMCLQSPYKIKQSDKSDKQDREEKMPSLSVETPPRITQPQDLCETPSLCLSTQSRKSQLHDLCDKPYQSLQPIKSQPLERSEKYFMLSRKEITRHLERKDGSCIIKHAGHHRVDSTLDEHSHTLCDSTQPQIPSAFTPARGRCYESCCHSSNSLLLSNIQKDSKPYHLQCYPIMIQEDQETSPILNNSCQNSSKPNYSLPNQSDPIIIDCFSLASGENDEEIPGLNQKPQARYQYKEEKRNDPQPRQELITRNRKYFDHNCMICQQMATGEMPQSCCTSDTRNNRKCCYATRQPNSVFKVSAIRKSKDEQSESYWNSSQEERKLSSSLRNVPLKKGYEHEKNDGSDHHGTITQDRIVMNSTPDTITQDRIVVNSTHDTSSVKIPAVQKQDNQIVAGGGFTMREKRLDTSRPGSFSSNSNDMRDRFTSTNPPALYSPVDLSESRKSLEKKWEAMYDILQESDKVNKKSYYCNHCGRAFTHLSSLNNHIRTHTGQKPFNCRYCGKRFAQSGVLTAHLRTHTGDKPFKCVICGKRFAQTTTLANHIRTHTGQKPFSCKYCKRTFAQSSTRNKHELSHTKEKPFECKYCGRSFTQSATVLRHMRIHMRDTKYSCVHCGKTFAYLYSLDKHLDVHT